eukprot:m.151909 g.151909  ORF g.151909 m.151909 type:complete len:237 (+) comp10159_c0_seq1:109-819(+)
MRQLALSHSCPECKVLLMVAGPDSPEPCGSDIREAATIAAAVASAGPPSDSLSASSDSNYDSEPEIADAQLAHPRKRRRAALPANRKPPQSDESSSTGEEHADADAARGSSSAKAMGAAKAAVLARSANGEYVCTYAGCRRQGRPFVRKQDFQKHFRIHSKERPYTCRIANCDRRFSDPSVRTRHEATHIRPICGDCGQAISPRDLADHALRCVGIRSKAAQAVPAAQASSSSSSS